MFVIRLVLKNLFRHKLRTTLTIVGIAIAVLSFGFIRTVVTAWSSGVEASAANRMITRHNVSFVFPLPLSYRDKIGQIPGVDLVSFAIWFNGSYKDVNDWKNFFPRIGVDADTYFDLYPEYLVDPQELATFKRERNSCIVGAKLAKEQNLKIGDILPIEGDIYPGQWEFVIRGIYHGKDPSADETQMFFHWKYVDERLAQTQPGRTGLVGWYVMMVQNPDQMPQVAQAVDARFLNSRAPTKTETEKEFQQDFVSMSSAIIKSFDAVSVVIVGIILLVLANTIVMSGRERTREYAVLKTLGFRPFHIIGLIAGESIAISVIGGILGLALTYPLANTFGQAFPTLFPIFRVQTVTLLLASAVAAIAALVAALFPAIRTLRIKISDALRAFG
jgi:putative ABC transport system permease protein